MRLLNTATIELHEFEGADTPDYAILSHRWETDEVPFQDMKTGEVFRKEGYEKIKGCCLQVAKDGWQYAWIDTCCIDKSSSAELSQAINSMYQWYHDANVCYAYLSDVSSATEPESASSEFRSSKWFARGWTLQELLAPSQVVFFNRVWVEIGTKSSLEKTISEITGIKYLFRFGQASVAQKMSWASMREATRIEDMAYSLLGLFGVHMPPLYGQGENAFLRLQIEILNMSDDESIFAWEEDDSESVLLAKSPSAFRYSSDVRQIGVGEFKRKPYFMTNKGLQIECLLLSMHSDAALNIIPSASEMKAPVRPLKLSKYGSFLAPLNCIRGSPLAIRLERSRGYQYYRVPSLLYTLDMNDWSDRVDIACEQMLAYGTAKMETIHIRQREDRVTYLADGDPGHYEFLFEKLASIRHLDTLSRWDLGCSWNRTGAIRGEFMEQNGSVLRVQMLPCLDGTWAACIFGHSATSSLFGLILYVDTQYLVGVCICDFSSWAAELSKNGQNLEEELRAERRKGEGASEALKAGSIRRRLTIL
jgi:hypothetical protein